MIVITRAVRHFIVIFAACWMVSYSSAQMPLKKTMESIDSLVTNSLQRDVGIIPAPIFNPTFGTGIAVLPVFIYRPKNVSDDTHPSTSQGILFVNLSGSYIAGAKQTLYTNHNRFWLDAYMGFASMKMRQYESINAPKDSYKEIRFTGFVSNFSALFLARKNFYIGPIFSSNYILQDEITNQDQQTPAYHWYHTPGVKFSYDSRDDIFYPVQGWFSTLSYERLLPIKSHAYKFDKILFGISNYQTVNTERRMVLASRVYTQLGLGNLPLHEMASPGASPILRGYITGNYLNSSITSVQAEFRWMFTERWGTVGFMGYGYLFDQPKEFSEGWHLPSVGAGLRYRIFKQFKINMALDAAIGRNSANVYFSLSESF